MIKFRALDKDVSNYTCYIGQSKMCDGSDEMCVSIQYVLDKNVKKRIEVSYTCSIIKEQSIQHPHVIYKN